MRIYNNHLRCGPTPTHHQQFPTTGEHIPSKSEACMPSVETVQTWCHESLLSLGNCGSGLLASSISVGMKDVELTLQFMTLVVTCNLP